MKMVCQRLLFWPKGLILVLGLLSLYALRSTRLYATESPALAASDTSYMAVGDAALEEGKALYENGQYIAALGKFMSVLRREPHNPEARRYLRLVVDTIRQNPGAVASSSTRGGKAAMPSGLAAEELRAMMERRARLTMDLKAIPNVRVNLNKSAAQVEIDTPLLFADKAGGLKEQGIPVLDRVSAWLKTYGQQPVIIHCYPEELQDAQAGGSLFLQRYSELYNFFVEERKLPPQRFVSADLLQLGEGDKVEVSSATTERVVIETFGSQSAFLEAMPSGAPKHTLPQWLEIGIMVSRQLFNPEEGEWASMDLAALTRTGLRSWTFQISPMDNPKKPVFSMDGKGNLLKRFSWDGHDDKTGSFVPAGSYNAHLTATDSDGTILSRDVPLQVMRATAEPVVVAKKTEKRVTKSEKRKVQSAKRKSKSVEAKAKTETPPPTPSPVSRSTKPAVPEPAVEDSDSLVGSKSVAQDVPAAPAPSAAAPAEENVSDSGDSVHAIWKQVIQFEPGQSDLKPTVKASLERIGKTLEVYPLQKVRIMGFAMSSEPDAAALAKKRAEAVRTILVEQYSVDRKRVIVAGGKTTSAEGGSKVEMSITN